jgi:predicted ATP-grasp superfamily ATP-dependent carboligase
LVPAIFAVNRKFVEEITIIGASARGAAQSARRAGFAPYASDLFADVDLCETCPVTRVAQYPSQLECILRASQSGGWFYTGALENFPDLLKRWSAIRPLLGNGGSVVSRVRDPLQVAHCLRRAGLRFAEVTLSDRQLPRDGSWIRKPLRSAGGMHVERLEAASPAAIMKPCYFQRYIDGTPCSAVYVAARGKAVLLGVTRQLLTHGSYRYRGSLGPMAISSRESDELTNIGNVIAVEFGLAGLFGVDAVMNEWGVWPVEVNPRYTASIEILERALGVPSIGYHVTACRSGALPKPFALTATRIAGKVICFAKRDLTVNLDLRAVLDDVADVPAVGTSIREGLPVASILRSGCDEADVERKLQSALNTLCLALIN